MVFLFSAIVTEQGQTSLNYPFFFCLYLVDSPIRLLSSLYSFLHACDRDSLSLWRRFKPDISHVFFSLFLITLSCKWVSARWVTTGKPWIRPTPSWTRKDSRGIRSRSSCTMPTKRRSACSRNWPTCVTPLKRRWLVSSSRSSFWY